MTCKEIQEMMPDLVLGGAPASIGVNAHLQACPACAAKLADIRKTMALLDEWQAPEPSPYFDMRFEARLREEKAKALGWLAWIRRPAIALVATALVVAGIAVYRIDSNRHPSPESATTETAPAATAPPGTAVGDLMQLDKNEDLYSNFDLLDDLQVQQQDTTATP
jgi:anti-sigma factor RsiW